jgi:hypothetical protein
MTAKPSLRVVQEQPLDIAALNRADIAARNWEKCHIDGDRRAPVYLPDRVKRLWRR